MNREILILGPLSITDDGVPLDLLRHAKGCALLAYLLVRGRAETREHLADMFWDSRDTASSLRNLRVLLARIRHFLPSLIVHRTSVQYIPRKGVTVDYILFTNKLSRGDANLTLNDLRLYRGELVEGFYLEDAPRFMEWLVLERERLRRAVLDAHRVLCEQMASASAWQEGAQVAAHWIEIDDLDEEALRWELQFLSALGQFAAARQAYENLKKRLWERLHLKPEAATQTLVHELSRAENQHAVFPIPDATLTRALMSDSLPEPGPLPGNAILPYHRNDDFLGRADVLRRVAGALGERRGAHRGPTVALTGIGGMGKTQIAVEFAYRYGRFFPGGVFWLNFSEPENVMAEVAAVGSERGLGLYRETDELSLNDRIGRVLRAWQDPVPRLLVFDNCEDGLLLNQWQPVTGGCHIVLTSRQHAESWSSVVQAVPLNVLSPEESVCLLRKLAPHIENAHAVEIAATVGHLPLALHLAGVFLRRYQHITPSDYIAQLREKGVLQHPSLQGHGANLSPTGHDLNVARTFSINWERLDATDAVDAAAQKLLAYAACLAPGELIPAGWLKELVAGNGDSSSSLLAEDALARLAALGLLNLEAGQNAGLHPLLQLFTQQIAGEKFMETARTTVANKMIETLSSCRQTRGHLSVLPFPAAHLRHVNDTLIGQESKTGAALAIFLGLYLDDIGNALEAEMILFRACIAAELHGDATMQAHAWNALASTQESQGHDADSLVSVNRAIHLFKRTDPPDVNGLAEAFYYQGWAYYRLGQADAALASATEGYALSRASEIKNAQARLLNLMAVVNYYLLGQYETAQENLKTALGLYREIENRQGESVALNNLGENARLQGKYDVAEKFYGQALQVARDHQAHSKANVFLSNLCGARIYQRQFHPAMEDLEFLIVQTQQDWYGLSEAYRFLSEAYLMQQSPKMALAMAQQALALASDSNLIDCGRAWRVLGMVATALNKPIVTNKARQELHTPPKCFQKSLDFFQKGDLQRDRAITLWRWAEYEYTRGEPLLAKVKWVQAQGIFRELHLPVMMEHMQAARRTLQRVHP